MYAEFDERERGRAILAPRAGRRPRGRSFGAAAAAIALPLAVVLLAALLLAGCSSREKSYRFVLRHNAPPEQPQHRALLHVADLLNTWTNGRIQLVVLPRVSIPGQLDDIANGSDELGMTGMGGLADYYPPAMVFEAPYMFRDLDHFYHTVESPTGRRILAQIEQRSRLHVIEVWHQGIRQVTLRDEPATTPEEFGRIRLRIPMSTMYVEAARVLGALPTTLGFSNVYVALRAGAIDAEENPLSTIRAMRFNEVCRYLVLTSHMISTIVPVMGNRTWSSLSPEDQALVTRAFREGGAYNRRIIEQEERRLVEEFAAQGMIVLRPDLAVFRTRARQSWRRFEDIWGPSLVQQIQAVR